MPKGIRNRWLAALIVFGPTAFVAVAAFGDWAIKPPHGWIVAQLIIILALFIGQQFYRKRILGA